MSYHKKLKDPRWQKKRLEILERDDFTCQNCGSQNETLQIHHWKYNSDPWEIEDCFLVTLCGLCHEKITEDINEIKNIIFEATIRYNGLHFGVANNTISYHISELKMNIKAMCDSFLMDGHDDFFRIKKLISVLNDGIYYSDRYKK